MSWKTNWFFICFCLLFSSCDRKRNILLKSSQKLMLNIGSPLIMGLDSVGNVVGVDKNGTSYYYVASINKDVGLRVDAVISESTYLMENKKYLKIENSGSGTFASEKDTIVIRGYANEKPYLQEILDSLEIKLKKISQ